VFSVNFAENINDFLIKVNLDSKITKLFNRIIEFDNGVLFDSYSLK